MKHIKFTYLTFLFVAFITTANAQHTSKKLTDEEQIENALITYIENFFENKFEEMNAVLHPRLSKRGLNPDRTMYQDLPPAELKKMLAAKPAFPKKDQNNKVRDIKIFRDVATATLETGFPQLRWLEFAQLVKLNNEWKIITLFWEYCPDNNCK